MSDSGEPSAKAGAQRDRALFRHDVAAAALRLYADQGYEATSAEQIAAAAGLSRSTFFRQFRSKEDVVFADHDALLEEAEAFLAGPHEDPWDAVCAAAELVFAHFDEQPDLAQLRYQVVNHEPSLRDKELVTTFRYERLFRRYLRAAVAGIDPLDAVRFAATVIATHNYFLRALMRGEPGYDATRLRRELDGVRRLYGVLPGAPASPSGTDDGGGRRADDVVVAVFPRSLPPEELARRIREQLEG
ncbi:TetR/AcrR family transcriptional regulator [Sinomonas sp. P47F7]|uniref:TetR/AcrR family transcriptional regulator n=1 Tax=Sinomonas sp. P47F7 TaxID=3410987 RepID=UPI003BF4A0DE